MTSPKNMTGSSFFSSTVLLLSACALLLVARSNAAPVYAGVSFPPSPPSSSSSSSLPSKFPRVPTTAALPTIHHSTTSLDDLHRLHAPLAAWGWFNDTIAANGWSFLAIYTNISFTDAEQAYAAGYLEGSLTAQRTWEYINNAENLETGFSRSLAKFVEDNSKWVSEQVTLYANTDPLWHHVSLLYTQNQGMFDGYSAACAPSQRMQYDVFYAATLAGEKDDLCVVYGCKDQTQRSQAKAKRAHNSSSDKRSNDNNSNNNNSNNNNNTDIEADFFPISHARRGDGHCSVLVKVVNGSELYAAHTTWSTLETMTRVYKMYDMPFSLGGNASSGMVPGRGLAFSSYPAMMFSMDDFYTSSTGLMITETTIVNNNETLWKELSPSTLFDWVRNMIANRFAVDGASWATWFAKHNSGTYNNEFMIVDYKKFTPNAPLQPGLLTVLEQMPGATNVVWADVTTWLAAHGYWASYNRPFFPYIQEISDQAKMIKKHGEHYSWLNTSRAVIFRENVDSVVDEESFKLLMRWNHFQTDAIATQGCTRGRSASNAISERGDLTLRSAGCFDDIGPQDEAGTDCKYTTHALMQQGRLGAVAQSGPTYDTQPPFVWSSSPYSRVSHLGQPDTWKFPWVNVDWNV